MRCRHTVPDWHRYVVPGNDAPPIYAACRLLVREGERASEPRAIACAYWGRQEACPLYEGPRTSLIEQPGAASGARAPEVPVDLESVWPVRRPGEPDPLGVALLGFSLVAILALTAATLAALAAGAPAVPWLFAAAALSITALVLNALRMWAGR